MTIVISQFQYEIKYEDERKLQRNNIDLLFSINPWLKIIFKKDIVNRYNWYGDRKDIWTILKHMISFPLILCNFNKQKLV